MKFLTPLDTPTFTYTTHAVGNDCMTLIEDHTFLLVGSFDHAIFGPGGSTWATVRLDGDRWVAIVNGTLTVDTTALWRRVTDLHAVGRYDDTQVRIIHNILNLLCFGFAFASDYRAPILVNREGDVSECDVITFFREFAKSHGSLCSEDVFFVPSDLQFDDFSAVTDPTTVIFGNAPEESIWEWDWPVDTDGIIGDYEI